MKELLIHLSLYTLNVQIIDTLIIFCIPSFLNVGKNMNKIRQNKNKIRKVRIEIRKDRNKNGKKRNGILIVGYGVRSKE